MYDKITKQEVSIFFDQYIVYIKKLLVQYYFSLVYIIYIHIFGTVFIFILVYIISILMYVFKPVFNLFKINLYNLHTKV